MNLFAYGTLMFDEILSVIVKKNYLSIPGLLENYTIRKFSGAEYPGIFYDKEGKVSGRIILDINGKDLSLLDDYEGPMYQRMQLRVSTCSNTYECQTYVVKDCYKHKLSVEKWCPVNFKKETLKDYLKNLK